MNKIRISKRPNRPRPQQTIQQLISRILGVIALLVLAIYCLIPLAVNPDIMRWLQSGDFVTTIVAVVVIYVIYSMISKSNFSTKPVQIKPPVVLRYEICSVCKQEKLLCDLYDINGRIICKDCIDSGVKRR